jgi:hypothetical protein
MTGKFEGVFQPSNGILKTVFQTLHERVANNVNVTTLIGEMFSKHVLCSDDVFDLDNITHRVDKCRRVLILLHKSDNPKSFVHLRSALESESAYEWLVEEIDEKYREIAGKSLGMESYTSLIINVLTSSHFYARIRRTEVRADDNCRLSIVWAKDIDSNKMGHSWQVAGNKRETIIYLVWNISALKLTASAKAATLVSSEAGRRFLTVHRQADSGESKISRKIITWRRSIQTEDSCKL